MTRPGIVLLADLISVFLIRSKAWDFRHAIDQEASHVAEKNPTGTMTFESNCTLRIEGHGCLHAVPSIADFVFKVAKYYIGILEVDADEVFIR